MQTKAPSCCGRNPVGASATAPHRNARFNPSRQVTPEPFITMQHVVQALFSLGYSLFHYIIKKISTTVRYDFGSHICAALKRNCPHSASAVDLLIPEDGSCLVLPQLHSCCQSRWFEWDIRNAGSFTGIGSYLSLGFSFSLGWTTKVAQIPKGRFYQKCCFLCHGHNNNLYGSMTSLMSTEENWHRTRAFRKSLSLSGLRLPSWSEVWRYKKAPVCVCMHICT